jgi:predicted transcriptional regulator
VLRLENLCDLLFELSNEDRLRILHQLNKKAMNVTNLSKALGLTTQESSRHLSRLGEVGLTKKDVSGLHHISPYGKLILKQLPGLKFTSQHSDYFTTHSLERLPIGFLCRLGDLAESTYTDDIMVAFHSTETMIKEAKEYIWVITDQYIMSTIPLFSKAFERRVKVRTMDPKHWVPPPKLKEGIRAEDAQTVWQARTTGLLKEKMLERLDIYLYMSEKEVATLAFPTLDGKFDYLGFTSTDEQVHKWCSDLFQHYWERAEIKKEFVLIPRERTSQKNFRRKVS